MGFMKVLFGSLAPEADDTNYSAAIDQIEQALAGLPEKDASLLACEVLLMAQVAHTDFHICEGEKERIATALKEDMRVPGELADKITNIAVSSALENAIERYLILRKLNDLADGEQKRDLIRALFHVACEGDISEAESDQIGSIAHSLLLPRSEFVAIRSEFSEHRAILKGLKS